MKKEVMCLFLGLILLIYVGFVSAEKYTINIKGEVKTPNGNLEQISSAGLATDKGTIESDTKIDSEKGTFEIKNAVLDTNASFNYVAPFIQGNCFYYSYRIMRKNNQFEVSDGYGSDQDILIATTNTTIDLGILTEDKSNQVMVDFDVPVKFLAEDLSGNWVAENGGYAKFTGMSNSFKSNTKYKLTLKDEKGDKIIKEITTGDYCYSTRVIKRGNYFLVENFPNNSFPKISFFKEILYGIFGLRLIIIIPLIIFIFILIIIVFFTFKKISTKRENLNLPITNNNKP